MYDVDGNPIAMPEEIVETFETEEDEEDELVETEEDDDEVIDDEVIDDEVIDDEDWWTIKGYTSLDDALASGLWDADGNAIAQPYIDIDDPYQDEPQPTIYDDDVLPDHPPVTTTPQWWETDYDYASLEDAIASGNFLLDEDGNIVFDEDGDPVLMPDATTKEWWELTDPPYASLDAALATGLYNADGTPKTEGGSGWTIDDQDSATGLIYGGTDSEGGEIWYRPEGVSVDATWDGTTWVEPADDTGVVWNEGDQNPDTGLIYGGLDTEGNEIWTLPEGVTDLATWDGTTWVEPTGGDTWTIDDQDPATGLIYGGIDTEGNEIWTLPEGVSGDATWDGTTWVEPELSFNIGDVNPDTGWEWDGVGWTRPDIPITFMWDGTEWIDPSITPVGADIGASDLTHRGFDAKAYAAGMSPEQYQNYLETIGFMPSQEVQPPSAEASQFAKDIAAYAGTEGEYRKDYDIDRDGEITVRDSIWQMQIDQGLRYPDGTPAPEFPPLAPADSQMYDPEGYFGQGYTPEDLAQTYGPGALQTGMTVDEYLTYLDEVSRRGVEGLSGVPVGMPEYGEQFPALVDPEGPATTSLSTLPTPLGYRGGVDPEWNYFPWSNPPSYEYEWTDHEDDPANISDESETGGTDDDGTQERFIGGQIKSRKAGGGNLARFGNMNIIEFEDEDDAMRSHVMQDTYRAQAGMALPQGQPQGQPNEDQIIMEAQAAILGEHPDPDAAIQAFIIMFGPEAFEAFRQQVLEGAAGGPVQTQGLLQGAGGGMDDTMMGPIGNTGNQLAASPGEVVLPADYVAMAGDGNTDAGAERIMHGTEPLPSVDEMRQFKYGQEKQPPSMNQYLAWKGGKI